MRVIVIGGGIIGLTTGISLLESGCQVSIWAHALSPNTTSDVAAAQWYPHLVNRENLAKVKEWGQIAYEHFRSDAPYSERGVLWKSQVLQLCPHVLNATDLPLWRFVVDNFRRANSVELPSGYADGYCFDAPLIDMSVYLPHLVHRFRTLGGHIRIHKVDAISEVFNSSPIAVNCSGLGSRDLIHDPSLFAVRGQVVYIRNRGLTRVVSADYGPHGLVYIVPRNNDIVLGGISIAFDERTTVVEEQTLSILRRCQDFMPAIGHLSLDDVQRVACGLRPARTNGIRLECEEVLHDCYLIHNYGHGGAGVTLSWGCAAEVVTIVQDLIRKLPGR